MNIYILNPNKIKIAITEVWKMLIQKVLLECKVKDGAGNFIPLFNASADLCKKTVKDYVNLIIKSQKISFNIFDAYDKITDSESEHGVKHCMFVEIEKSFLNMWQDSIFIGLDLLEKKWCFIRFVMLNEKVVGKDLFDETKIYTLEASLNRVKNGFGGF